MKLTLHIVLLLLILAIPLCAQQKKQSQKKPTNKQTTDPQKQNSSPQKQSKHQTVTQRKQIEAYKKINELAKQGIVDETLFFRSFYELIQPHCGVMIEKNNAAAKRYEASAVKASEDGFQQMQETYDAVAELYHKAAITAEKLNKAITDTRRGDAAKHVDQYITTESEIRKLRFKPVPREWYSIQETVKAIYSPKKK